MLARLLAPPPSPKSFYLEIFLFVMQRCVFCRLIPGASDFLNLHICMTDSAAYLSGEAKMVTNKQRFLVSLYEI
jgi:hypothetical protein